MLDTLTEKAIHQECIDSLPTEVYKFLDGYSPDVMNDVSHLRQNICNLRNVPAFATDVHIYFFFFDISYSKNFKFACCLGGFIFELT